jgi:hypothetical protein
LTSRARGVHIVVRSFTKQLERVCMRSIYVPLLAASLCAGCHNMMVHPPLTGDQGVNVVGEGKASAPPDIARTSVGVDVRSPSAEQASADATARMNAVVAAVKQAGVADPDLRVLNLSITFEPESPSAPAPKVETSAPAAKGGKAAPTGKTASAAPPAPATPPPAAPVANTPPPSAAEPTRGVYHVTDMLELTIRDPKAVGRVLKAASDAGANVVWGVSFELENIQPLIAKARAEAVAHAKQSAEDLARLTGATLGRIVAISEGDGNDSDNESAALRAEEDEDETPPIEHGQITVSYVVNLVFAIKHEHEQH